jgi:hypothetical protein
MNILDDVTIQLFVLDSGGRLVAIHIDDSNVRFKKTGARKVAFTIDLHR